MQGRTDGATGPNERHARGTGAEDRSRLRAALLGVYAHVHHAGVPASVTPAARVPTASEALRTLGERRDPTSSTLAATCLAKGALRDGPGAHERRLRALVGHERAEEILSRASGPLAREESQRRAGGSACGVLWEKPPGDAPTHHASSMLDPSTLVTTATVDFVGQGDFDKLAAMLDPRSWQSSVFWEAAYQVMELPDGQLVPDPAGLTRPLGQPWQGIFYEHVTLDGDPGIIASFQNYLDIAFEVTRPGPGQAGKIELFFSLRRCRGSLLLERITEGGIDIDHGCSTAEFGIDGRADRAHIHFEKNIRYGSVTSRSTSGQGRRGAGELLSMMAPAMVGVWMEDLAAAALQRWQAA